MHVGPFACVRPARGADLGEDPDSGAGPALSITEQMCEVASGDRAAFLTGAVIGDDPIRVNVRPLENQRALVVGFGGKPLRQGWANRNRARVHRRFDARPN